MLVGGGSGNGAGEGAAGRVVLAKFGISPAYRDKSRAPAGPWLLMHLGDAYVTKVGRGRGLWACKHVAGAEFGPHRAPAASHSHTPLSVPFPGQTAPQPATRVAKRASPP